MNLTRREILRLLAIGGAGFFVGCNSTLRDTMQGKLKTPASSVDTLILDFDGTLTNVEEEAKDYVDGYCQSLGRELGLSRDEIEDYWNESKAKILKNPEKYGWELEGIIVASATSDPLIICYSIADEIC